MSLHYASEAVTVLYWNRLSDHIGRKPVLLCCLAGTTASIVLFGLSRSFWTIVLRCHLSYTQTFVFDSHPRSLQPLSAWCSEGKYWRRKSAMVEITDETSIARGFSLLEMAWSAGYVIGLGALPVVPCLS